MDSHCLDADFVDKTYDFFSQQHYLGVCMTQLPVPSKGDVESVSSSFGNNEAHRNINGINIPSEMQHVIDGGNTGGDLSKRLKIGARILAFYNHVKDLPPPERKRSVSSSSKTNNSSINEKKEINQKDQDGFLPSHNPDITQTVAALSKGSDSSSNQALINIDVQNKITSHKTSSSALERLGIKRTISSGEDAMSLYSSRPVWHPPWELMTLISSHLGWVRCIAVDPTNNWFATGSADRTIKIWDLARHELKLTLTGHVASVRSLVASCRHPYLFSSGEDQKLMCWDLETNKAIRQYFGHRSGIYSIALHPELDLIISGSRDRSVCVWDMRTRTAVYTLTGHDSTVFSVAAQASEPQVISGSSDSTIKYWDLVTGKCLTTLTNHKKTVRALLIHPRENTMASGGADTIKKWKFPHGNFIHNFAGHHAIINSLSLNHDNVMVSAADNGTMGFWDWKTGHLFQQLQTIPQPGSLASEAGIFATAFDRTGSRLITAEIDKSIKIWREVPDATPETHPINWRGKKHRVEW